MKKDQYPGSTRQLLHSHAMKYFSVVYIHMASSLLCYNLLYMSTCTYQGVTIGSLLFLFTISRHSRMDGTAGLVIHFSEQVTYM